MDFINHAGWGYVMALGIESIVGFKSVEFEIAMATSGALPDAFIPLGFRGFKKKINYKWRKWSHNTWWLKWMPAYWLHCKMDEWGHHQGKLVWWTYNISSWFVLMTVFALFTILGLI